MEERVYIRKGRKRKFEPLDDNVVIFNDGEYLKYPEQETTELVLRPEEQVSWFIETLNNVYNDPRFYLENLEYLNEYKVGWNNYGYRNTQWHCQKCGHNQKYDEGETCKKCKHMPMTLLHFGMNFLRSKRRTPLKPKSL
jgi:rubrerythrin